MLNAIKSIDPLWGDQNIPPKPEPVKTSTLNDQGTAYIEEVTNQEELDEWDKLFKK